MQPAPLPTRRELRKAREAVVPATTVPEAVVEQPPRASRVFSGVDGMRGVAILSVLFYHSGWTDRGLFGVDVFFVVSGFLITLLMLQELQKTGRLRIGSFFARRARRLVPGLIVTLGSVLALVWWLGSSDELERGAATAVASLAQIANWHQIAAGDAYWEMGGQIAPFAQMWSLSVTEQFYIAWPFVVLGVWFLARKRTGRFAGIMVALFLAAAAVAPILFDGTNTDRLYLGTDARAVAFVAGAVAAAVVSWLERREPAWGSKPAPRSRVALTTLSIAALLVVLAASVLTTSYHEAWLYQGGLAVVAAAAAVLTGTLCFPGNALVRVFSIRPLPAIGRISYSLFLLHLPVFWLLQVLTDGAIAPLVLFGVGTAGTLLAAIVLHHMIAEPLRTARWTPVAATVAIVTSAATILAGSWWLPVQRAEAARSTAMPVTSTESTQGLRPGVAGGRPVVVTVGDSIAVDWAAMLAEHGGGQFAVDGLGSGGCGLLASERTRTSTGWIGQESSQQCARWRDRLAGALADGQADFVVVHTAWDATDQWVDGRWITPCSAEWRGLYSARISELVSMVEASPTRPQILLADDRPSSPVVANPAHMTCFNDATREIAESLPTVTLLPWGEAICPDGKCRSTDAEGHDLFKPDDVHLTTAGMRFFAPWLEKQLTEAQRRTDPAK